MSFLSCSYRNDNNSVHKYNGYIRRDFRILLSHLSLGHSLLLWYLINQFDLLDTLYHFNIQGIVVLVVVLVSNVSLQTASVVSFLVVMLLVNIIIWVLVTLVMKDIKLENSDNPLPRLYQIYNTTLLGNDEVTNI